MFTGLVEEIGVIQSVLKGTKSAKIVIKASKVLQDVKLGDSICTNGVCLTVTDFTASTFAVDIMAETMRRSNLKNVIPGSRVNLERALRLGDRLGGHWVSGHIDGVGTIKGFEEEDNAIWVSIEAPAEMLKYIILKGSIAIDGVSLTVADVHDPIFKVSVIPHTKDMTTLLSKSVGDEVNLECDIIGKYIERIMLSQSTPQPVKSMDMDFLRQHGFA
ncbi:MAG: riboflavin synthase [Bacillota bacterium]